MSIVQSIIEQNVDDRTKDSDQKALFHFLTKKPHLPLFLCAVVSVTSSGADSNCHQYKRQQNRRFNLRVVLHEMGSRSICGIKRSKVADLILSCYKTPLQRISLYSLDHLVYSSVYISDIKEFGLSLDVDR